MSKVIDLSHVLTVKKPVLKLGENKYTINNTKNAVILANAKFKNMDEDDLDLGAIDEVLTILLGKKVVEEIDALELPFTAYQEIFTTVTEQAFGTGDDDEGKSEE